jgi:hypothetical protein
MIARLLRTAIAALALVATLAATAPAAHAHGDPSAHYLETGPLYPSFANRPSQALELQLLGLLQAAEAAGYPVKVALVGAEDDVGDTPQMLHRPQHYAEQLASGLEAERQLRAPVLVVSPHGLGIAGPAMRDGAIAPVRRAEAETLLAGVQVGERSDGDALARAAMAAVRQIARAGGSPLPAHVPPAAVISSAPADDGRSMAGWLPFGVFAVVFLLAWLGFEVRTRAARRRHAAHPVR